MNKRMTDERLAQLSQAASIWAGPETELLEELRRARRAEQVLQAGVAEQADGVRAHVWMRFAAASLQRQQVGRGREAVELACAEADLMLERWEARFNDR